MLAGTNHSLVIGVGSLSERYWAYCLREALGAIYMLVGTGCRRSDNTEDLARIWHNHRHLLLMLLDLPQPALIDRREHLARAPRLVIRIAELRLSLVHHPLLN